MKALKHFTDEDFRRTVTGAIRLLAILAVLGTVIVWLKVGWESAALLMIGAFISASGLWEWLRLMTAIMSQMDTAPTQAGNRTPVGSVLLGFIVRLGITVVLLYGSLKYLHGSVFALAAGLGLGVICLSIEGIRLMKAWTV